MKYAIGVLLFITTALVGRGQDAKRVKLKITGYSVTFFDKAHDVVLPMSYRDTSLIFVFNSTDKKIIIYGKTDRSFDITKGYTSSTYSGIDYLKWTSCLDPEGIRCNIRLSSSRREDDKGYHFVYIDYADVVYTYIGLED